MTLAVSLAWLLVATASAQPPTPTVGANDCCQCDGTAPSCGPGPQGGSCFACLPIYDASCNGDSGNCEVHTPTPTQTATEPPTVTPTSTPSETPTETPTSTSSATPTATSTPTATPTDTPTPTVTAIATPTIAPTSTPLAPEITGGAASGSSTVTGVAIPNPTPGNNCIQIYSCGPNGMCYDGDDQLIGTGSVNAQGLFVVNLTRPLILGERIYARDVCNDLTGLPITVTAGEVAPAMSPQVLLLLSGVLTLVGALGLRRLRLNP